MKIDSLRHRLTIEAPTYATGAAGSYTVSGWTTFAERWGNVRPLSGNELLKAKQITSEVTHEVTLRHLDGLTSKHRLKLGSREFNILSVINVDERNWELKLMVKEIV